VRGQGGRPATSVDRLAVRGTAVGASQIKIIPEIGSVLTWDVDDVYYREVPADDGERHVFLHFIARYPTVEDPDAGTE
jgi:hypothetical protein